MKAGIFGVGNEFREDDGVGLVIVAKLKALFTVDNIDFLDVGERLFEISALMMNYTRVVIIDALPQDSEPGKITVVCYGDDNFSLSKSYSLHDLDLLCQLQYAFWSGFRGEILLVGIEAESLDYKKGLSLGISCYLSNITLKVAEVIEGFLG